jgi:Cu(I)/Ag(I) efflux system membrane protein CusA/SilA
MIEALIEFSARRRGTIIGLVFAAAAWGAWCMRRIPLDALPDLSDVQVILYSQWDRSADVMEDQVTYPIVTAMLGAPRVKAVRGVSDFGSSFVYVVFEDGTDLYWARSRTQEYLSGVLANLPSGVRTELGPDATGLGWIFEYALKDDSGKLSLADLRTTQDYFVRYQLRSVPGVADVAAVGGFVSQYQVTVDPARMRALDVPFTAVVDVVRRSNTETAGHVLEFGGSEYMIRGRGYLQRPTDLEQEVLAGGGTSPMVRVKDVARVSVGPAARRGIAELDGNGETVSGIVIMRQGGNVTRIADEVKRKLKQISKGLPAGVRVVPIYDRSELIHRVIANLCSTLTEIVVTVVLVILIFLSHPPSAAIPIVTIPLAILTTLVPFHLMGLSFNVMSLGGIAIAVGALVDAGIVVVEQTHKKLEEWQCGDQKDDSDSVILAAVKEVGRPAFFSLLIMAVAFIPVLALEGEEGRLFHPLAYAKSLTMLVAAVLAVTLDPVLRLSLARLRWRRTVWDRPIRPESQHLLTKLLMQLYQPALECALRRKYVVASVVLIAVVVTVPIYRRLGAEFVPPLDEGVLMYMPSTAPGISITEAKRLLQITDARLREQPEVAHVLGKAGRADTATDPAPLSMLETIVVLKPRPEWPRPVPLAELIDRFDCALRLPGIANTWTMPVRSRTDMLATGIRTPLGLKIEGPDLERIQDLGVRAEDLLRGVRGTRSVLAERIDQGRYIDVQWDRSALARAGISMQSAQTAVQSAIGGESISTVILGRARYPVSVRFTRDSRSNLDALRQVPVDGSDDRGPAAVGELAAVRIVPGPSMIRDENGMLTGYVYLDLGGRDPADFIAEASDVLTRGLTLPSGYTWEWSGQYESFQRVSRRLLQIIPLTLAAIALLLYWNTGSAAKTCLVMLAVPFSAIGAVWGVWLLGYPVSPAVWVGVIALLGVDAETGIFMLLYLDIAWQKRVASGEMRTRQDLRESVLAGAVRRIRPKFMTVSTMFLGLVPILWSDAAGAEVMKRIAAPIIGGLATSFLMELAVFPILYEWWRSRSLP